MLDEREQATPVAVAVEAPAERPASVEWKPGMTLAALKLKVTEEAFFHCRGNMARTARLLDVSIRSVRMWLRSAGVTGRWDDRRSE